MTWSSSSALGAAEARRLPRAPSEWTWDELDGPGGNPARDMADLEARHTQELEHAFRQGRFEGEKAGRLAARQELESVLATLRTILEEVQASRTAWQAQLTEDLVGLSTAVARQLLARELESSPEIIHELVLRAASAFPRDQKVKVRMHPMDLARLGDDGEGVPSDAVVGGREARWIADESIEPGGYVIEGPERIIDGRVREALERIYWELTDG